MSGADRHRERARREAADWFARRRADGGRPDPAFEAWRAADPENGRAYDRMAKLWDEAALLRFTETGRARELPARSRGFAFLGPRPVLASLVGLLLLLGFSFFIARAPLTSSPDLATRTGEIRTARLPDGSKATLDTASHLALAFTPTERRVRLTAGRARFDVAPRPSRPFVVETAHGVVIARGTVFDVGLRRGGLDVTLLHGVVEVRPPVRAGTGRVARLRPGQRLTLDPAGALRVVAATPARNRWASGMLAYEAVPLDDVLDEVNRYTPRPIRLSDPALGRLQVTGTIRTAPADGLGDALARAFGLEVRATPDGGLVLERAAPRER